MSTGTIEKQALFPNMRVPSPLVAFAMVSAVLLSLASLPETRAARTAAFRMFTVGRPGCGTLAAFLACCGLVIVVSRYWPKHRDGFNVLVGTGLALYLSDPYFVLGMYALSTLVYFVAPKIKNAYVAMGATVAVVLVFSRYILPFDWVGLLFEKTGVDVPLPMFSLWGIGWISLRLVVFAFEGRTHKKRNLISFFAYAPFGVPILMGEPPMLSYLTYFAKRKQADLDELGARQLVRASLKILALAVALEVIAIRVYSFDDFLALPLSLRWALLPTGYINFYLYVSGLSDFAWVCRISPAILLRRFSSHRFSPTRRSSSGAAGTSPYSTFFAPPSSSLSRGERRR